MCNYCNSGCGCNCGCNNGWVGLLNIFTSGRCGCNSCCDAYYAAQYALCRCDSDCGCSSSYSCGSQNSCGCSSSDYYSSQSSCCGSCGRSRGSAGFFNF